MENKKEVRILLNSSADAIRQKKELNGRMNQLFKDTSEALGVSKDSLRKCKDYVHYHGLGMSDTLTPDREYKGKFRDRVAPSFRKVREIIINCVALGYDDLLQDYLNAMRESGITIVVNKNQFRRLLPDDIRMVHNTVDAADGYQTSICELANQVRDDDAIVADAEYGFVKKSDYKKVAEFYEKKDSGKDVELDYERDNNRALKLSGALDAIFHNQLEDEPEDEVEDDEVED